MQLHRPAITVSAALVAGLTLSACGGSSGSGSPDLGAGPKAAVVKTYADIAQAVYSDSLADAKVLQTAIGDFLTNPNATSLDTAKTAWAKSRETYQQSEVLRFDEGFVSDAAGDDGGLASVDSWEGQLNAWPLDEALIDYVSNDYEGESPDGDNNIISSNSITVNGTQVDTSNITPALLASLNEIGGSEANVATGYHAIEFLLWGQDGSQAKGVAGQRPVSDYLSGENCTGGHCDRRRSYLSAVTQLLVDDLTAMVAEWNPASSGRTLRADLLAQDVNTALQRILYGAGSLALGELASERMRVARLTNSPEDEHDCFSDTSHNSYYYNGLGVANIYRGRYTRRDGSTLQGASLGSLIQASSAQADTDIDSALDDVLTKLNTLKASGDAGETFDYLIDGNDSNQIVKQAEESLISFTDAFENGATELGIAINSDGGSLL